jgi:hypothetical protein
MQDAVPSALSAALLKPYAYSFDRETFRGDFPTREQALEAGLRAAAGRSGMVEAVYVGRRVPVDAQVDHHAEDVVRSMRRRMQSRSGDGAYLAGANEHVLADLDAALARTIAGWLAKHGLTPAARVSSISEHPLPSVRAHATVRSDEVQMIGPEQ